MNMIFSRKQKVCLICGMRTELMYGEYCESHLVFAVEWDKRQKEIYPPFMLPRSITNS